VTEPASTDRADVIRIAQMTNLYTPWSLRVAVTLGLPDLIAAGVRTATDLSSRAETDPAALVRLLRHLKNLDLLTIDASGNYELTRLGEVLCSSHPARMASLLDQENRFVQATDAVISALLSSIRSGGGAWNDVFGTTLWENLAEDPELSEAFDRTMSLQGGVLGPLLARSYDWTTVRDVVDVGGGNGRLIADLLLAHPHLLGTVLDLPATTDRADQVLAAAGVADRGRTHGQSFFEPLTAGADVYLLVHVVHNWPDTEALALLTACAQATGPGGTVMVVDQVIDLAPGAGTGDVCRPPMVATQRDLCMLAVLGSRERTQEEFVALAEQAGLVLKSLEPLAEDGNVLLIFRAV
jgi:SAM-dependent methyltransferase